MTDDGREYADVLKEAQELGYAEANPSADVDGFDSMYKLSILSSLAFNKKVPLNKIYREGISKITKEDIEHGKQFGYTLKLLAIGKQQNDVVEARVHPAFLPHSHPLAAVKGSFNAVMLNGDNVGDIMLYGRGAGDLPTGSAIVSDIIYCASQTMHKRFDFQEIKSFSDDFVCKYYIRMTVDDKSGVLSKVASVLAKYDISIKSLQQKPRNGDTVSSIIFLIHETNEQSMNKAIAEVKSLNVVKTVDAVIRVI